MTEIPQVLSHLFPIPRQDGLEQITHKEENGVAQPHGDKDGNNTSIQGAETVFLHQDRGAAPGAEEGGETCPRGGGAGFLSEQGAAAAVVDVFVVFRVVVDLLEGADLVQGVGEGEGNGAAEAASQGMDQAVLSHVGIALTKGRGWEWRETKGKGREEGE